MQINKHFSFRVSVIKDISKSDSISQLLIRNRTTDPTKSKEDLSPSVPDLGKIRQGGWLGMIFLEHCTRRILSRLATLWAPPRPPSSSQTNRRDGQQAHKNSTILLYTFFKFSVFMGLQGREGTGRNSPSQRQTRFAITKQRECICVSRVCGGCVWVWVGGVGGCPCLVFFYFSPPRRRN